MRDDDIIPLDPRTPLSRVLIGGLALAVLSLAAVLLIDGRLARAVPRDFLPAFAAVMIDHSEVFGDGCGVMFFLAGVWLLDPNRRRCLPRLALACWGSGIAANVVKLCIARPRPYQWIADTADGTSASFGSWFPLASQGTAWQSFPSAHTATAVGLAIGLSVLYPRGRVLFIGLAAL